MSEPQPLRPSFATVLDDLWRQKFTGRFNVDCQSGVPIVVEIPEEPQRIRLEQPAPDPATDRRADVPHHLEVITQKPCVFPHSAWTYNACEGQFQCPCGRIIDKRYRIRA